MIDEMPLNGFLAAVSVGKSKDDYILDLCYEENVSAIVDLNLVMKDDGELIEIQGRGEGGTFSRNELDQLLDLGEKGIKILIEKKKAALGVIDFLKGKPGIHSARYGGISATAEEKNRLILDALKNVPYAKRGVYYVCCLYFINFLSSRI